ncbi:hypothetical protein PSOS111911_17660 [Pseudoalteromonas ostreae]
MTRKEYSTKTERINLGSIVLLSKARKATFVNLDSKKEGTAWVIGDLVK